jgi:hypothetical protein
MNPPSIVVCTSIKIIRIMYTLILEVQLKPMGLLVLYFTISAYHKINPLTDSKNIKFTNIMLTLDNNFYSGTFL